MNWKLIAGGGRNMKEAIENMGNKIEISPSKDECLFVIASTNRLSEDEADVYDKWKARNEDGSYPEKGGVIVFSTDVNAKDISSSKFKNYILQKFKTAKNRLTASKILDKIRRKHDIYYWTVGKYLKGIYTGKNGKTFNENSISLDMFGVDRKTLFETAEDICRTFEQEAVMVKDNAANQVYFVTT